MAGVFKSLDKSDVRITPFRTHKLWSENVSYTKIEITGSVSNSSSFYELQAPYSTKIYDTDPVTAYYYVNSDNILGYAEVDSDTFELQYNSATVTSFSSTPLVANKYIAGVLDNTDGNGPSRVITIESDPTLGTGGGFRIKQMDYQMSTFIGGGMPYEDIGLSGSYINRIDYYPFAGALPVVRPIILVSHNQSGSYYGGLLAMELDVSNKQVVATTVVPYLEPPNPILPPYWGADNDYRGDYYAAIPSTQPEQTNRILAIYKDSTSRLMTSNIELQGFGAAYSASYSTISAMGDPGEHATTGVVDIVGSKGFAYFTLKGQNNIYGSSFDISLSNYLKIDAAPIVRLLCDKDMIRYDSAVGAIKFQANSSDAQINVVAVLEDGTILNNINASQFYAQFTYEVIDARQYVGANSKVTGAAINKNVDLISSGSASLLYVWVEPTVKGKSSMFVVNLDTNEIQDPIHVGFLSNSSQPLFGTQQSGSNMLTADNRTTTVLGFTQNISEINPTTGVRSRYLYKFDVQ